ncbi:MAG: thiamine phosphate synthase [Nitrospirae bacterium]|nr:thiamine phosphate synthase [Nitrospirota bacterium]
MDINFQLYLITDRKRIADRYSLIAAVRLALKGGVKAVQLREKDLNTRELLKLAYKMRALTNQYKAKLFINDRFDIALAVGADGVHLTQNSIPTHAARNTVKKKLMIGVSTHSLKEAKEAEKGGADFITFGPVYRTPSKLKYGESVGLDTLRKVSGKIKIPVFAIGGIKGDKINDVMESGAYGVAMISEIFGAEDIKGKSEELINILRNKV